MKLAVFTDIHFRPNNDALGIDPDERLSAGLAHVERFVPDLDRIIITGDLAHEGDEASYQRLKNRLEQTNIPITLMVGNHDHRETFLGVFENTEVDENGFVQSAFDTKTHRLIFLDTLNGPPYKYPSSHIGHLCHNRLAWLSAQLETAGSLGCVIFMHHPPHKTGFVAMDTIRLGNENEFYDVVEQHNNVQHIFCGHVHRNISGQHRGIPFQIFKSTVGQMPMLFDVMNFHMESNEPPAYGLIHLQGDGIIVHTEDYGLADLDALRQQALE